MIFDILIFTEGRWDKFCNTKVLLLDIKKEENCGHEQRDHEGGSNKAHLNGHDTDQRHF